MQKLGKYEILAELGHGAMGVVYKARDPLIGRLVALKTINSALVDRPDLLERFYQEAQSAGKLQHPNIVTIFELGKAEETPYIAMEYLDGESLEKAIAHQKDMPLALKVGHIVRICQALEYAHKNRVVHRDVKPANIMVNSEGVVKVVDFGIARLVDYSRTNTNMMIGTPSYMAPELFRKKKADARSDIWAVGVTFYELLCYERPFNGEGYDIVSSIMEDDFPFPSGIVAGCPPEIDAVIRRMLMKSSAERYQTMEEVLLDLEPVWNTLRSSAASALIVRAHALYQSGDLLLTQETLRQARQIDSSNVRAKTLLEKVSADLRQRELLPMIEEHLKRGRAFAQSRQFREAQAEAEAALELDSRHELAQEFAAEVGLAAAQAQRHRELQQRIQDIRAKIKREEFTDAIDLARQTLTTIGPDTDITQLLQAAQVELEERNKKASQIESLPDSPPFSPTDMVQKPLAAVPAIDSALPPQIPTQPSAASSPGEPSPAMASATPRIQAATPVLTPPPISQSQAPIVKEQTRIDLPLQDVPAPRRRASFAGRSMLAVTAFAALIAAGFAYRYVIFKPGISQPPASSQIASEIRPQPSASPTPPPPNSASPNAVSPAPLTPADEQLANTSLAQGVSAYNRRDYAAARSALDQSLARAPQTWSKRPQAADYQRKAQVRLQQEQHWKQAQSLFATGNYDAAKNEANQAISTPDGDPTFNKEASKLIASIPSPVTTAAVPPNKSPEPPPKDFGPVISTITAAINQSQWDDAEAKLNTLPSDRPEYPGLKQRIADGREDQAFAQKRGEFAQADSTSDKVALRNLKTFFTDEAGKSGRHREYARTIAEKIDSDLKEPEPPKPTPAATSANSSPASVAPSNNDPAAIKAVLDAYAKAFDNGDLTALKAVRQIAPSEERRFADALKSTKGKGFVLLNCSSPEITGDSAKIGCDVAVTRDKDTRRSHTNLYLNRLNGKWIIVSSN